MWTNATRNRRNHDEEMKKYRWTKRLLDERRLTIDAVPRTCSTHWLNLQLFHTCLVSPLLFEMSGCERMRQSFPKWILGSVRLLCSLINRTTTEYFFQPTRIQIFNIFDSIDSFNVFYLIPWPTHFSHPVFSYHYVHYYFVL